MCLPNAHTRKTTARRQAWPNDQRPAYRLVSTTIRLHCVAKNAHCDYAPYIIKNVNRPKSAYRSRCFRSRSGRRKLWKKLHRQISISKTGNSGQSNLVKVTLNASSVSFLYFTMSNFLNFPSPTPLGDLNSRPHLIQCVLSVQESPPQTGPRSV